MDDTGSGDRGDEAVSDFDVAIVGLAGRFPGAPDLEAFWSNLEAGRESVTRFDDEALLAAGVPPALVADPNYVKAAPVLDEPGRFDAAFFGYTPRDAELIDPQQRQLLELSWLAFEDAGIVPGAADARTATFAGTAMNTYLLSTGLATRFLEDYLPVLLGSDKDFQATRVAFKLGLRGPALSVQTACSTSLVAIHLACQSLINRESDLALATAAAVRCPPTAGHLYEPNSVFTPDGHCRPFDDDAAGTIFGSGGGAVLLKRLSDALEDGDPIRAVIKGSAVNNDGDTKSDYTAPTVHLQAEAISEALGSADVSADTVSYVEAHGTGTFLGDPIEVAALTRAFRGDTERTGFCGLGSVKSNIGHLDAAAGIASLCKVVLAMERRQLPPTANFRTPNAQIDFAATPFRVVAGLEDWQAPAGSPRRAGVTSLGMGGTNAHVVLEESPLGRSSGTADAPVSVAEPEARPVLLPLSARTDAALDARATDLARHLDAHPELSLQAVASTLRHGRKALPKRRVVLASSAAEAGARLGARDRRRVVGTRLAPREREVVMMFPGQGAQRVDMGRRLHEREPVFRESVDRIAEALGEVLGLDLRDVLFSGRAEDRTSLIDETRLTQPALFAIEYAYLELWRARGVMPAAFIGHSIGEYVAATAAGVFAPEDAARLVAERGRLMQSAERGSMLAVHRPEAEVAARLPDALDIAVVNAADAVVVAGESAAIEAFAATLAGDDIKCTPLRTSHAFHSRMMEPVLEEFAAVVAGVDRHAPSLPFVSNRSGTWITSEQATDPAYWADHVRGSVRFDDGLATLLGRGELIAVEAGPGTTLSALANQHAALGDGQLALPSAPPGRSDLDDEEAMLLAHGQLWCSGLPLEWPGPTLDGVRRVSLPGYRFEGKSHWFETRVGPIADEARRSDGPLREVVPARWVRGESWMLVGRESLPPAALEPTLALGARPDEALLASLSGTVRTRDLADVREGGGHRALVASLDGDEAPARILYDWPAEADPEATFLDLVHLVQALASWDGVREVVLDIVVHGALDVLGDGVPHPSGALALGVSEVTRKEWPHVRSRVIDVGVGIPAAGRDADALGRAFGGHGADAVLGVRDGRVWARRSVEAALPAPLDAESGSGGLPRTGGSYLLTGGFGGVGRHLARRLAARGARLVLTHRPASRVDDERRRFVEELVALGGRVESAALALDDVRATTELLARLDEGGEPPSAVFHLAGHTDDAPLSTKSDESMRAVLEAKLTGTRTLDAALATLPGRAPLVLFSSVAAWSGPVGQVDYAAANAWQMAFARAPRPNGAHPVVAIAWPGWRDTGMVTRIGDERARRLANEHGIEPGQGLDVLEALLGDARPRAWVSPLPLDLLEAPPGRSAAPGAAVEPDVDATASAKGDSVEERVARHWKALLGFDDIGADENYFELGGTSLVAVKLCGRLERDFDVPLAVEELLGAPTVASLASLIESRLPSRPAEPLPSTDVGPVGPPSAAGPAEPIGSVEPGRAPAPAVPSPDVPTVDAAPVRTSRPSLVPIVPDGARAGAAPVYLVHAHGGMVIGYQRFAREIARHRPVFGLQSRGVRGEEAPLRTIEEMAARYAEEIVRHRPEGPYILGGYCMGGTIAWEIARQLEAAGRPVALVFLLQSFHRDLEYPIVQNGRTAYPAHVGTWRRATLVKDKAVEALVRHARDAGGIGPALAGTLAGSLRRLRRTLARDGIEGGPSGTLDSAEDAALLAVHAANGEAFDAYRPGVLHSPVVFLPAEHQPRHVGDDPLLGWQGLALGRTSVRAAPGSFLTGLDGLGLDDVADALEQEIRGVLETDDASASGSIVESGTGGSDAIGEADRARA